MEKKKNLIKFWYDNARPQALPQSIIPSFIACAFAFHQDGFNWVFALMAVVGVLMAHLGSNLFDDYFDYRKAKSDFREKMQHQGFRARIAKSPYLTNGTATSKQLLAASSIMYAIGITIAFVLFIFRGEIILYFMGITALLGLSYSANPLKLSYRGFGEIMIGMMFGPLLMFGVYYAACGNFDWNMLYYFVPVGFLVMNIVFTHAIMDYEPDKQVGKMTLAVKLKNRNLHLATLFIINILPYAIVAYAVITGNIPSVYLLVFLIAPMTGVLLYLMVKYVKDPGKQFPKWMMFGKEKNWDAIVESGNDWFLLRWFLARNIVSYFSMIIVVLAIIGL
jgi:1,4-dihydroxy-2-naphthoate octaprenyltransferase